MRTLLMSASVVAVGLCASCSPASSPASFGTSHLEITFKDGTKKTIDGVALARLHKDTSELDVRVFADADPPVDCDNLDTWMTNAKKGSVATMSANHFNGNPGRLNIAGFGYASGNSGKGELEMKSEDDDRKETVLTLPEYGPKGFSGTLSNAAGAKYTPQAKGTLRGKVCPATTQAEMMKKARESLGIKLE